MNVFRKIVLPFLFLMSSGVALAADGLIVVKSNHSVAATADKLEAVLSKNGMKIMNRINHAAGAESANMELRPTELVIFGNPKVGTPLMQCSQTVAVDLPQKALIWEDENGQVWLGYNDPQYLKTRHAIEGCDPVLAKVGGALKNFARAATAD
ncbi:DUF302 domain-containing protein [Marinobacter sp. ELB17]|uniref:DUF302 domain-containing protein n=1 Tax=Marinobacter sp. ELB17 TaxID=270374 RepID=UPI0000F36B41|nr:DUF302 domain-containing protein [Marinobacter sp. ELB17]EBA01423.1 hypothetical protein MELB17_01555 [Marinobacter sp. ELB17]